MRRGRIRSLAAIVTMIISAIAPAGLAASGASAAPTTAAHRFQGLDGTGAVLAHSTSWPVTYYDAFRDKDESIANRTSGAVRFCYTLDYGIAWVCLDHGMYSNDVAPYAFNNGAKPGLGKTIWLDIASIGVTGGTCGNPLPLP
jgi:hypothetical protein